MDNIAHPNWPVSPEKGNEIDVIEIESVEEGKLKSENDLKLNTSKMDHTPKSTIELLHNLSEIFNNTPRSDKQRSEGQHLLNSLAELLSDRSNGRSCNLDDSGHSSSMNDISDPNKSNDCYRSLDVCQTANSLNICTQNLSVRDPPHVTPKQKSKLCDKNSNRLSLSLNCPSFTKATQPKLLKRSSLSRTSLDSSKNRTGSSNSSVRSDNLSAGNLWNQQAQGNLKVKMNLEVSKKGPLKAMIPMKQLKKSGEM